MHIKAPFDAYNHIRLLVAAKLSGLISTFRGIRTRLEFKVPSRLCLERNNEFLTCSTSQCDISLSTSLSVSLLLSVTTYNATKNQIYTTI